jgi:hypothetical protein
MGAARPYPTTPSQKLRQTSKFSNQRKAQDKERKGSGGDHEYPASRPHSKASLRRPQETMGRKARSTNGSGRSGMVPCRLPAALLLCFLLLNARPCEAQGLAVIPSPPVPAAASRTLCPHLQRGLKSWHNATTWGGAARAPTAGANVTLPASSKILLSQSLAFALGYIVVPATSELIIGENRNGIELRTSGIEVRGGKLTVGSPTCRVVR